MCLIYTIQSFVRMGGGGGEGGLVTSPRSIMYVFTIHEIIKEHKIPNVVIARNVNQSSSV